MAALKEQEFFVSAWQPIESAPKDGRMILAFNVAHREMTVVGWQPPVGEDEEGNWDDVGSRNAHPAIYLNANYFQFWMPLPVPPLAD